MMDGCRTSAESEGEAVTTADVVEQLHDLSHWCEPARSNAIAAIIKLTDERDALRLQLVDLERRYAELAARSESK